MDVTRKSRLYIRLQNIAFVVLFLAVMGLLAWLSTRYTFVADWTATGRNTLSEASIALLETIDEPVSITAFVRQTPDSEVLRRRISEVIERYRRHNERIRLQFINPDVEPQQARELGIGVEGELVLRYAGRRENVQNLTEENLTNALQRLVRGGERWIVFMEGHGERGAQGQANHDLKAWAAQLENKGFNVQSINLGATPRIPENTSVLVIAGPRVDLLPGEVRLINDYVEAGGALLWLTDPGEQHGLEPVAERLGLEVQPGVIVDPTTQLLAIGDPRFAVVSEYGPHPVTRSFNSLTLYPQACGIDLRAPEGWDGRPFLVSAPNSWSETGELKGEIELDAGADIPGPLNIGVSLARDAPVAAAEGGEILESPDDGTRQPAQRTRQQRVIVVCDGDFLSNAYLGNAGNLDLGLNIMNWLSRDDTFIDIPAKTSPDLSLELSQTASVIIVIVFLLVLPLAFLGGGIWVWLRRRKA